MKNLKINAASTLVAAMLVSVAVGVAYAQQTPTYTDVDPRTPLGLDLEWLTDAGLVGGYQDGTYRPSDPLTRGQYATILCRQYADFGCGTYVGTPPMPVTP